MILAQTPDLTSSWSTVANQSILGLVTVTLLFVIWRLVKLWIEEKIVPGSEKKRLLDERNAAQAREQALQDMMAKTIAPSLERMTDILDRLQRQSDRESGQRP